MDAKDRNEDSDGAPTLAVVICTRDRPASLIDTLRSLRTQSRQADELLILDDGKLSEADRERIAAAAGEATSDWRIIPTGGCGLTASRNLAARSAKGDILLFLDDDVTCEPHVVAEIVRLMADPLVSGVTATVDEPAFRTRSARLFQWGYRLAGWWGIAPRGRPEGARPNAMNHPAVARRARWLSGAAMALRRSVLLAHPFDESLTEYALGEDREMGYRLAPTHWLLESCRARVVHRRDGGGRVNPYRMGFMTARNYAYILRKTCRLTVVDVALMGWSFLVLGIVHAAWAVLGRRAHWDEMRGLIAGACQAAGNCVKGRVHSHTHWQASCQWHTCSPTPPVKEPIAQSTNVTSPPLRALFVTNRLTHGGAERMLLTLAKRLPPLGITPTIACLQDAGPLAGECESAGVVVHEGILRHKTDVAVILRLRQIIEAAGINVVVVAHSGGDRMFWPTLAAAASDLPVVVWSHWFPQAGTAHIERCNRALYRFVGAFVALGEAHKAALVRHEHVPAGRISVIRNGIELGHYNEPFPRAVYRTALGLSAHEVGVGLIANLRPEKRHDLFIKAAAQLAAKHPHVRFFIIGDGPGRMGVEALIQDFGLDSPVIRLLGARDDTPELLRALDIACLCSDIECMPVVMLEAAAAGCAFIGPEAGCIPEFVAHRKTGLLVKPSDEAGLADAISELSRDAALRARLASAAQLRVTGGYGAEAMAAEFARLLRECVTTRRGQTREKRSVALPRPIDAASC